MKGIIKNDLSTCRLVAILVKPNLKFIKSSILNNNEGTSLIDPTQYQWVMGMLMYVMLFTRVDIAYAMSLVSQFYSKPLEAHWWIV